jgi:RNA polymerase sigma-70 factor (ECF subfamily)
MSDHKNICKDLSDQVIIEKARSELRYFACLYERYESRMLRYISKISGFNRAQAEDVLQDSFLKIWSNINDYDPDLSFKSWLYRIVHRTTISQWRKNDSLNRRYQEAQYLRQDSTVDDSDFENDLDEQNKKHLYRALDQLKNNYREIIILKFFENLTYEEISDILKIPEGTVATRINRAKKQLHKHLGGETFLN